MKTVHSDYISICIPAYHELELINTLESLANCRTNALTVKVYVLINGSANDGRVVFDTNMQVYGRLQHWVEEYEGPIEFLYSLDLDLPVKHAGVGLARKILGDTAAAEFEEQGINGIISYLDADCEVQDNYFLELSQFFKITKYQAAAIHFEHRIDDPIQQVGIIEYELHLRYFIDMQKFINLPFAIHTVGSSMAVLSKTYISKGGMNKRKAGEDFYFLQKFVKDGLCGELNQTTVFPSSRQSDRVPFGTGRAMLKYNDDSFHWDTYNMQSFLELSKFIDQVDMLYDKYLNFEKLHPELYNFLLSIKIHQRLEEIRSNVSSSESFKKRFFHYFDAFQLMKYLHHMRDHGFPDIPIDEAVSWLFDHVVHEPAPEALFDKLKRLREIDKANG